ncbi:MAG: DUF3800 domain-containing protein [Solirubrobacterales bacterium]|nr:DUF3800 domain-containing protein [Solirubrobacterales bacterium]
MDLFAIDDSAQPNPSRDGMGPLMAVGGLRIPGANLRQLEVGLDDLCARFGFPAGEEFKWSPGRDDWMRGALIEEKRTDFFLEALRLGASLGTKAIVVIAATNANMARKDSANHEEDVTALFLERAQNDLNRGESAIVVFDRPGGGRKEESAFLAGAIERLRAGTSYTTLDRLSLALATDSKLSRSLQLADVVAACTTAFVAGEETFSPPVFEQAILPMLREDYGCKGGRGLKIHPDFRYGNLYHWLLGDEYWVRYQSGEKLPRSRCTAYHDSADVA